MEKADVWKLYRKVAPEFDRARDRAGTETGYLERVATRLPPAPADILDLGCGSGAPIAKHFVERGHRITGIDAAPEMLALARERFPDHRWIEADMRAVPLNARFDAVIAWDSFFHLPADDQRAMFSVFAAHSKPGALLLFTGGPAAGVAIGDLFGHALFHDSLAPDEYARLLDSNGFDILRHVSEDPECAGRTVWLAQQRGAPD